MASTLVNLCCIIKSEKLTSLFQIFFYRNFVVPFIFLVNIYNYCLGIKTTFFQRLVLQRCIAVDNRGLLTQIFQQNIPHCERIMSFHGNVLYQYTEKYCTLFCDLLFAYADPSSFAQINTFYSISCGSLQVSRTQVKCFYIWTHRIVAETVPAEPVVSNSLGHKAKFNVSSERRSLKLSAHTTTSALGIVVFC